MVRDFTYVDDIVHGIVSVVDRPAAESRVARRRTGSATSRAPYRSTTSAITGR